MKGWGTEFLVAKLDRLCEFGNQVFLFFDGAVRPSCGASGRASVRSLGFLEPSSGVGALGCEWNNEIAIPWVGVVDVANVFPSVLFMLC